jgi:hypothetical protein
VAAPQPLLICTSHSFTHTQHTNEYIFRRRVGAASPTHCVGSRRTLCCCKPPPLSNSRFQSVRRPKWIKFAVSVCPFRTRGPFVSQRQPTAAVEFAHCSTPPHLLTLCSPETRPNQPLVVSHIEHCCRATALPRTNRRPTLSFPQTTSQDPSTFRRRRGSVLLTVWICRRTSCESRNRDGGVGCVLRQHSAEACGDAAFPDRCSSGAGL